MTLGQNLQAARKAKGLSQETLAEQIGVSRQALGKWEKDTALPGLDNLQAAAQVLGVSVDTLAAYVETLLPGKGGIGRYYTDGFVHVDVREVKSRWVMQ